MKFKPFLCAVFLSLFSSAAIAGYEEGTVRFQHGQYGHGPNSAGKMFFYLEGGDSSGVPSCATFAQGQRWVIDNNWPAASIQLSILLAAHAQETKVRVRGSNDCGVHGDSETAVDISPL